MKVTLLWVLPFAAEFALARPAPDDGFLFGVDQGGSIAQAAECTAAEPVGNTMIGFCSTEKQVNRVLYKPVQCPLGQCSIPSPRCDTGEGHGMGYCMDASSTCSPKDAKNGRPGRPGNIVKSWCYQEGIPCCDGEVTNVVSFGLPSQFIDAMLPLSDEQLSSNPNPGLFSSNDFTIDDGSVQVGLLPGTGISSPSDDLFASNGGDFTSGGDVAVPNDLLAANGDASWFQG